jgi:hypothetical protein
VPFPSTNQEIDLTVFNACGTVLADRSGELSVRHKDFRNNANCTWTIRPARMYQGKALFITAIYLSTTEVRGKYLSTLTLRIPNAPTDYASRSSSTGK